MPAACLRGGVMAQSRIDEDGYPYKDGRPLNPSERSLYRIDAADRVVPGLEENLGIAASFDLRFKSYEEAILNKKNDALLLENRANNLLYHSPMLKYYFSDQFTERHLREEAKKKKLEAAQLEKTMEKNKRLYFDFLRSIKEKGHPPIPNF